MESGDIERTWQSAHNHPSDAERAAVRRRFEAEVARRRRGSLVFTTLAIAGLAFATGRFLVYIVAPQPSQPPFDLSREWGALLLMLPPWVAAIALARQYWRGRAPRVSSAEPVAASVQALLADTRLTSAWYKWSGGLLVATVIGLPLCVYQLRSVGKAGDEVLLPALVLFPAFAVLMLISMVVHHKRRVAPRKRELERLLQSFE